MSELVEGDAKQGDGKVDEKTVKILESPLLMRSDMNETEFFLEKNGGSGYWCYVTPYEFCTCEYGITHPVISSYSKPKAPSVRKCEIPRLTISSYFKSKAFCICKCGLPRPFTSSFVEGLYACKFKTPRQYTSFLILGHPSLKPVSFSIAGCYESPHWRNIEMFFDEDDFKKFVERDYSIWCDVGTEEGMKKISCPFVWSRSYIYRFDGEFVDRRKIIYSTLDKSPFGLYYFIYYVVNFNELVCPSDVFVGVYQDSENGEIDLTSQETARLDVEKRLCEWVRMADFDFISGVLVHAVYYIDLGREGKERKHGPDKKRAKIKSCVDGEELKIE
jgi:hypothetical protein